MQRYYYPSFEEASNYAKDIARIEGVTIKIEREGTGFVVVSNSQSNKPIPAEVLTGNDIKDDKSSVLEQTNSISETIRQSANKVSEAIVQSTGFLKKSAVNVIDSSHKSIKKGAQNTGSAMSGAASKVSDKTVSLAEAIVNIQAPAFATLSATELLKWSEEVTKGAATIYDKAMDAEYLKSHIGGGNHRMFDGGHDLFGAWDAVKNASNTDSFSEEVIGYASAVWKDVTTTKGLPFATWSKESYEDTANWVVDNIPSASKSWFYDLASFDVFEVMSAGLGVASAIYFLKKEDTEKLSEMLGMMGVTSIISANPIAGISVIMVTAYAYVKAKKSADDTITSNKNMIGALRGAGLSGVSLAIIGAMGVGAVSMGVTITVSILLRKYVLDSEVLLENVSKGVNAAKSVGEIWTRQKHDGDSLITV